MDDFKIIIYILAAVAYFILTQWRKAFKGGAEDEEADVEPRRVRPRQQQPERPVTSFEDILRELQPKAEQARQRGQEVIQQAKEKVGPLEAQPVPPLAPAAEVVSKYRSYENMAPKVLSWEKRAEAIEASKRSALRRQEAFEPYEIKASATNRYAQILRNPASAREAFVLSEIFNRRYN